MSVCVSPVIFERFPGMRVVVVLAHDIDVNHALPELSDHLHSVWSQAARDARPYGNAQSHPHIQPWREQFRAMGVSSKKYPSAIEALLRRVLRGDEPVAINALVDFYHTVSLGYIVPVGGFDLDALHAPLELRLTREGDQFQALDEQEPYAVPVGEVAYASGQTILTRHLMWRQAKTGLLTAHTHSAVLVAEVPGTADAELAEAVRNALHNGLQHYFGVTAHSCILDVQHLTSTFPATVFPLLSTGQ
jgi:DNA/RNA-binding domain of Phe-tRNA-synthetase-like protein